jgi:hypothetical protein
MSGKKNAGKFQKSSPESASQFEQNVVHIILG